MVRYPEHAGCGGPIAPLKRVQGGPRLVCCSCLAGVYEGGERLTQATAAHRAAGLTPYPATLWIREPLPRLAKGPSNEPIEKRRAGGRTG